jgi:hypothetical protein
LQRSTLKTHPIPQTTDSRQWQVLWQLDATSTWGEGFVNYKTTVSRKLTKFTLDFVQEIIYTKGKGLNYFGCQLVVKYIIG